MEEDDSEDMVDVQSLIEQLKDNNKTVSNEISTQDEYGVPYTTNKFHLESSDLEQFILNSSGKLVKDSVEMLDNMKDYVTAGSNPDDIAAFSELLKASGSTIDILNKILLQDKKSLNVREIKQLDINAKKEIAEAETQTKMLLSREDIMKQLLGKEPPVDAEIIED